MRQGPYIEIGPWRAWLEKELDRSGLAKGIFAIRLGVKSRRLRCWLRGPQTYVRLHIVEDSLWEYDNINMEEALGYDIEILQSHPDQSELLRQNRKDQIDRANKRKEQQA